MEGASEIFYKTSIQIADAQRRSYSIAGQKRNSSAVDSASTLRTPVPKISGNSFVRAASLPTGPPQLSASRISWTREGARLRSDACRARLRGCSPSSPSPVTPDPSLELSHPDYGLPTELVRNLSLAGIKSIYPWQKECLSGDGLLAGDRNLVYTAPTGGGKSLVAEVLMLKRVLGSRNCSAILVLPYVALVHEKVRWLRRLVEGLSRRELIKAEEDDDKYLEEDDLEAERPWKRRPDENLIRVVGIVGGSRAKYTLADFDIAVCTIEKANSFINAAINDCSIPKLRAVVLDELHMVDDDHRGYLLELLATKLLSLDQPVQIIGMSATMPNAPILARWLQAHFFETTFRPIPIEEHLVFDNSIYAADPASILQMTVVGDGQKGKACLRDRAATRVISASTHKELQDPVLNGVVALASETARAGYGVLVFVGSRAGCESDARRISYAMPRSVELDPAIVERRADLLGNLRSLSTELDPVLEESIPFGVAFHRELVQIPHPITHPQSGLTNEERELVASAFDGGTLKVCVATCGLAAGINLPARRVILHNAMMGREMVGPALLRQMRGRAGRKGKDDFGETYLCCRNADLEQVVELMQAEIPHITSCLNTEHRRIQRALLEAMAIRLATSRESINEFIAHSLLHLTHPADFIADAIDSSLADLQQMGFISADDDEPIGYQATQLGLAVVASALSPDDGAFIHRELSRALQSFVMDGEMHVLYTFTPVNDSGVTINWRQFWQEVQGLDDSGHRVLSLLGLKISVINGMSGGGTLKENTPELKDTARVYRRFYLAFQLRDLCNEMPVHAVARKYDTPRGAVQNLAQTCHGFAAGVIKFCEQMGWGSMAAALDHLSDQLRAGARSDLLSLAKITFIKTRTARIFWDNGYRSVGAVANADPKEIVPILLQVQPNKLRLKSRADQEKYHDKLVAKAKAIVDSAIRVRREKTLQGLPHPIRRWRDKRVH